MSLAFLCPGQASQKVGMGKDIYKDYGNWKGAAKLVGMDIMTPDWEAQYAAENALSTSSCSCNQLCAFNAESDVSERIP